MYQRFYSWQPNQRRDLFMDIEYVTELPNTEHHFMSTIVCYKTPDTIESPPFVFGIYDVVDGQQRLTTLIILLKAIS